MKRNLVLAVMALVAGFVLSLGMACAPPSDGGNGSTTPAPTPDAKTMTVTLTYDVQGEIPDCTTNCGAEPTAVRMIDNYDPELTEPLTYTDWNGVTHKTVVPIEDDLIYVDQCLMDENNIKPMLLDPGEPANQILLYGSAVNVADPSPYTGAIDYSGSVVSGQLNVSLTIPIDQWINIGYLLGGKMRVSNIRINGVLLTNFCVGPPGNPIPWIVATFRVYRNTAGVAVVDQVNTNSACNKSLYLLTVYPTGTSTVNAILNDSRATFDGSADEDIRFDSNLLFKTDPLVWNRFVWTGEYSETFEVLDGQDFYFNLYINSDDWTAPPGTYEPLLGQNLVLRTPANALVCQNEAGNWINYGTDTAPWYYAEVDGTTIPTCGWNTPDTRLEVVNFLKGP